MGALHAGKAISALKQLGALVRACRLCSSQRALSRDCHRACGRRSSRLAAQLPLGTWKPTFVGGYLQGNHHARDSWVVRNGFGPPTVGSQTGTLVYMGMGQNYITPGPAGYSLCFHLQGFHFGCLLLTPTSMWKQDENFTPLYKQNMSHTHILPYFETNIGNQNY